MGCGKGEDQLKQDIGCVEFVTFTDFTENSVEECKERYNDPKNDYCYNAEFFPFDSS